MTEPTEPKPLSLLPRLKLKLFLYIVVIMIFFLTIPPTFGQIKCCRALQSLVCCMKVIIIFVGFQKIKLSNDIELH